MDGATFDALVKRLTQTRLSWVEALRGMLASAVVGRPGVFLAADTAAKPTRKGAGSRASKSSLVGPDRPGCSHGICSAVVVMRRRSYGAGVAGAASAGLRRDSRVTAGSAFGLATSWTTPSS